MILPKSPSSSFSFELRVSIQWIQPEIWRLIRVPHDVRLSRLHRVLQAAFGWTNSHLHQFIVSDPAAPQPRYIGDVAGANDGGFAGDLPPMEDERSCQLSQVLAKPGDAFGYEYDFGDGWLHTIVLSAVHPQATRLASALCLDGARACPPEDCGGPPGYEEYLAAIRDPEHPEHDAMIQWNGPGFDPEEFEPAETNRALLRLPL